MITLTNVVKKYANDVVIGESNLTIPEQGIISLIGPNGSGKSTTLLMIGRLLKMDQGVINVANYNVQTANSTDLAKIISILRQENYFITRLTVRQLVAFGRFPYSKGRLTIEDEAIISKYIDFFALQELEHKFLYELSGGQRQRAYVAMVLCQETKYVLLDEPLNNLDIAMSVQMMRYLRQACDEFKRTVVLVMHDINFAARYFDRLIAMKDGHIVANGTVNELMNEASLSSIFDTPIHVLTTEYGPIAVY